MYNKTLRVNAVRVGLKEVKNLLVDEAPLSQWQITNGGSNLVRECTFKTFEQTWAFLTQVSMRAHLWGHHPTVITTYNRVRIELTTHDIPNDSTTPSSSGVLSDIDIKLAKQVEKYLELYSPKK
ncbi:similar to Saccharomyces cerevisiae YHL018W Putative protein of unknown function [Maudiozyma barnettii]|uniref:4a-hydroxytetrahydrobiopterin dehydratase n=1 Tax=Maudiozyma barnettii TaxID=61262 RepID=A0A8H2VK43_9SACH|nr:4a-hydroxytetrahydrobiopterin dehydratase [Kazachstania barnettii]CAB4256896.1 similar to Saccharomyces cerevisiae YHL018W Putative protein of unknown function [Kazachstania barnettii]CAD1785501.1 similar to Saccharomyces cerevisiae YHL018W Putative protein of unknown function [Kazachstania barnettii]